MHRAQHFPTSGCLIACFTLCADLLGRGIADGTLVGPVESVTVATRAPSRELLLAAMQRRGISLPNYDQVADDSGAAVPLARFWEQVWNAGGPDAVGICCGLLPVDADARMHAMRRPCVHACLPLWVGIAGRMQHVLHPHPVFPMPVGLQVTAEPSIAAVLAMECGLDVGVVCTAAAKLAPLFSGTAAEAAAAAAAAAAADMAPELQVLLATGTPAGALLPTPTALPASDLVGGCTPALMAVPGCTPFGTDGAASQLAQLWQQSAEQAQPPELTLQAQRVLQQLAAQAQHPQQQPLDLPIVSPAKRARR